MEDVTLLGRIGDAFAIAFWPIMIAFAIIGWWWRASQETIILMLGAGAVLGLTGMALLIVFDVPSLWALFDINFAMLYLGGLALFGLRLLRNAMSTWQLVGLALFGIGLIGYGGQTLVRDFFLPPRVVEGSVTRLEELFRQQGPNERSVRIDTTDVLATTRLFRTLQIGDRVRAEVGRGSDYIYRLERNSTKTP